MKESNVLPTIVAVNIVLFVLLLLTGTILLALIASPGWLSAWLAAWLGPSPKAFWYLSRAAGLVAYLLLWVSVALGLMVTSKLGRLWPGGPATVDLHQFTTLLGLGFAVFHALILLGDRYIGYTLGQILVPFGSTEYRPLWVGLGQLALYLTIPVSLTFYIRHLISYRVWRLLHYGTFAVYLLVTIHSLTAGTDTLHPLLLAMYSLTGLITLALLLYRIAVSLPALRRVFS